MALPVSVKAFDADVKIVHIGKLFRAKGNARWLINIWMNPIQSRKYAAFSLIPLLARGRVLNQVKRNADKRFSGTVKITDQMLFNEVKLSECPALHWQSESIKNAEGQQWAFKVTQPNGWDLYIPQLELARVLFLSSSYLARAAISTTQLLNDFDIDIDSRQNSATIRVVKTANFPIRAFDYTSVRSMIAWVLLDPNARRSFTSISQHFKTELETDKNWETWLFRFHPPIMEGWTLRFSGVADKASKSIMVNEITSLSILPQMPYSVAFEHGAFREYKKDDTSEQKMKGSYQQRPDEHQIDDEVTASDDSEAIILQGSDLKLRFIKPFITAKRTDKKRAESNAKAEESEEANDIVSIAEPEPCGDAPAADFSGHQDESDLTKYCESRFSGFFHMLDTLEKEYACTVVNKVTHALPKTARSKKHLLKTGGERMVCCVTVRSNSKRFKILEIDTSDGIQMLSTRIVRITNEHYWEEHYGELKRRVITSSLSWPISYLDDVFGESFHAGVPHPSHKESGKGNIPSEAIPGWAFRISEKLV